VVRPGAQTKTYRRDGISTDYLAVMPTSAIVQAVQRRRGKSRGTRAKTGSSPRLEVGRGEGKNRHLLDPVALKNANRWGECCRRGGNVGGENTTIGILGKGTKTGKKKKNGLYEERRAPQQWEECAQKKSSDIVRSQHSSAWRAEGKAPPKKKQAL